MRTRAVLCAGVGACGIDDAGLARWLDWLQLGQLKAYSAVASMMSFGPTAGRFFPVWRVRAALAYMDAFLFGSTVSVAVCAPFWVLVRACHVLWVVARVPVVVVLAVEGALVGTQTMRRGGFFCCVLGLP